MENNEFQPPESLKLYLDHNNLPTELALELIMEATPFERDPMETIDFVKDLWEHRKKNWKENSKKRWLEIKLDVTNSTKNHLLISALKKNKYKFWELYWKKSTNKGKHKLIIPKKRLKCPDNLGASVLEQPEQPTTKPAENTRQEEFSKTTIKIMRQIAVMEEERKSYKKLFKEKLSEIAKLQVLNHQLEKWIGADCKVDQSIISILEKFVGEVEYLAEEKMLKTGKLEGSHYAAMKEVCKKWKENQ